MADASKSANSNGAKIHPQCSTALSMIMHSSIVDYPTWNISSESRSGSH